MLPKPMPVLTGKEAEKFIEYDEKPLTKAEEAAIARSIYVFENIKPRKK